MRATITHKRQGNAGYRQETQIHADIYDYMAHKKNSNAHAEKHFKISGAERSIVENPPNHQAVKSQDEERTDKTPFLGIGGENKVRLVRRQELQPRLGAKTQTLAQHLAGADGDGGLESVITCPMNIRQGIDEIDDTGFLIRRKNIKPGNRKN